MELSTSESKLEKEIIILTKALKAKTNELNATRKSLKEEQNRRKQSSAELKKRNKELTEKNEDLTKQLEAVRNLQSAYEEKPSSPYSFVVDELLKKELHGLRLQHKQDVSQMATLKRELKDAHEKIDDLENVLEAHQLEIEEQKNESLNSSAPSKQEKDLKSPNKKNNSQLGTTEASKFLQKLVTAKKDSNNILGDINSPSYKDMRADFDAQLSTMKAENNNLVKSVTKVKLTTRSFEAMEKDLMALRAENNSKIKQIRKDAAETASKLTTLYKQFTKLYPQKCAALVDQYDKELKQFEGLNFWMSEKNLQEEIIKKLQKEKEFLITIISKQDDI